MSSITLEISLVPKLDNKLVNIALEQLKQQITNSQGLSVSPKIDIKSDFSSKDFMSGFDTQLLSAKNQSRELQGQLALMALEGKKGTDEFKKIEQELKAAKEQASALEQAIGDVGDTAEDAGKQGNKAFNFNQTVQSVQTLSGTVRDLSKPFVELDTATQNMKTLGKEAADMAPKLRDASIAMSEDLPFAAAEIQTTMFDALAAGVKGGEAGLKGFADTAAKLAVGGGAAISESTGLLAGQLNAYGESSEAAAKYADIFFNTVNYGVTSIPQLASTLANVVPTAASLGIEIENVGASIAVMTAKGVPAAQSTTKLNALLIELAKPGAALAPILKQAGVSLESLKNDSVPATLEKVKKSLDAAGKAGLEVFSSSEAAAAFNVLTGDLEGFAQTFVDVRDTTNSTQFAFEQMGDSIEVQMKSAKAAVEAFVIQGLDVLGANFVSVTNIAGDLAPTLTTLMGVKQLVPESAVKGLTNLKTGLLDVAKNGGGVKGALGVMGSGFSGMIAPIKAMGAALMSNPIFLIAGLAVGTIAAIKLISDAMNDTVQERAENAKQEAELLDNQKKQNEARQKNILNNSDLLSSYQELAQKTKRSATEEAELTAVKLKLSSVYPGMISANKSLTESLNEAGTAAKKTQTDYLNAVKDSADIAKKQLDNSKLQISLEVGIQKQELEDVLTDATNDISFGDYLKSITYPVSFLFDPEGTKDSMQKFADVASEFLFGTSIGRKEEEKFTQQYTDMVYKAKDSQAIANARIEFANAVGLRTDLTAKQKNEAIKQFDEFAKSQEKGLETLKKADADFVANRSKEFDSAYDNISKNSTDTNKTIADMARVFGISTELAKESAISNELKKTATDGKITNEELQGLTNKFKLNGQEAAKMGNLVKVALSDNMKQAAKDGQVTEEEISAISKQFGLTAKESKQVVELQQLLNVEAAKTKSLVDQVKGSYKAAADENKKNLDASVAIAQDYAIKEREAKKTGNVQLQNELAKARKQELSNQNELLQKQTQLQKDAFKGDLAAQKKEAEEINKARQDALNKLQDLQSQNNSKMLNLNADGYYKELQLLKSELRNQLSAIEDNDKDVQKNSKLTAAIKNDFTKAYNEQKLLTEKEYFNKEISTLNSYADKLREEESKKREQRAKSTIDETNALLDNINNKLSVNVDNSAFLQLTQTAADARLLLLEKQQKAELDNALNNNAVLIEAQREYSRALLQGDNVAAERAKNNVEKLKTALIESDTSIKNLLSKQESDRSNLQVESAATIADATILTINDSAQREYAISLASAQKTYREKLNAARGNHELILQAEVEFNQQKAGIEKTYAEKSNGVLAEANNFRINLLQNFQNEMVKLLNSSPETEAQKQQLDEQEKQLRQSLVNRKVTETEFLQSYKDIQNKRDEISEKSYGLLDGLQAGFSTSISASGQALASKMEKSTNDYTKLLGTQNATEADYTKARTQLFEDTAATLSANMIGFATQSGITMKSFAQQSLNLAFDMLQKNSLIIVAEIFGKSVAANPILGTFLAAGVTATFFTLINAAKSAIGRKTGEARIGEYGKIDNSPATHTSDNILRLVSKDEGIINARANMAKDSNNVHNYQIIEWANKTQKPIREFFGNNKHVLQSVTVHKHTQAYQTAVREVHSTEISNAIREQTYVLQRDNEQLRREIQSQKMYLKKRLPDTIKIVGRLKGDSKHIAAAVNGQIKSSYLEM